MDYQRVLFAFVISLFMGFGCSQSGPETVPDESVVETASGAEAVEEVVEPAGDIKRSLLWRAEGTGGPVWLFGTIHGSVDASTFEDLPGELQEAIESSELVVLEIDFTDLEMGNIASRTVLPQDQPLDAQLGEERWEKLGELLPIPGEQLRFLQPWLVYTVLLQTMLGEEEPVDYAIVAHATARNKEFAYLETAEEQIDIIARSITVELLGELIDDPQAVREGLDSLVTAYKAGDAETLEALVFDEEEMKKHPQMIEELIIKRNHSWMSHVEQYLERGHVFVAVGAGHLLGDEGLVQLLRAQGVEVTRVDPR
ncbi:MAG: TraB/GumN family protein [Bradymonadaceae bacterium]